MQAAEEKLRGVSGAEFVMGVTNERVRGGTLRGWVGSEASHAVGRKKSTGWGTVGSW
jgi:hypothetical protein